MKSFLHCLVALSMVLFLAGCAQQASKSGDKVTLELNLKPGQTFNFVSKMTQDVSMSVMGMNSKAQTETDYYFQYEVLKAEGEEFTLKTSYDRIVYSVESSMMGKVIDYDSEDPTSQRGDFLSGSMANLLDLTFNLVLNKQGQVVRVEGMEELFDEMLKDIPEMGQDMGEGMPMGMDSESMAQIMQSMNAIFPKTQVGVGDSWGSKTDFPGEFPITIKTTYEVAEIDANTVYLDVIGKIETSERIEMPEGMGSFDIEGEQNGVMEIDRSNGWFKKAELNLDITGEMEAGPMKSPVNVDTRIVVEPYVK